MIMAKKNLNKEDYKRTEIKWNLKKDGDVVKYLEENVDNIGGFLKQLARDYVRNQVKYTPENSPTLDTSLENSIKKPGKNAESNIEQKQPRKRLSIGSNAISSKELDLND